MGSAGEVPAGCWGAGLDVDVALGAKATSAGAVVFELVLEEADFKEVDFEGAALVEAVLEAADLAVVFAEAGPEGLQLANGTENLGGGFTLLLSSLPASPCLLLSEEMKGSVSPGKGER